MTATHPVTLKGRPATADERRGIAWWNALPEYSRLAWLTEAQRRSGDRAVSAADAWAAYKESLSR